LSAALHPTIPVHAPLVFDLIDSRTSRSIAQCTYHVAPPDGRVFNARPANAAEAEQRRQERFQFTGPAVIPMSAPPDECNPIYALTLDLRQPPPQSAVKSQLLETEP
jgi:uncharacterized protein (DUF2126 family)